jgi:hypothetical protein
MALVIDDRTSTERWCSDNDRGNTKVLGGNPRK